MTLRSVYEKRLFNMEIDVAGDLEGQGSESFATN